SARIRNHSARALAPRCLNALAVLQVSLQDTGFATGSVELSCMAKEAAMADDVTSRLGRGLAALMGDVGDEAQVPERTRSQRRVPVEFLKPNTRNPRRTFADADLDELADSIRERGIIQPILAR